MWIGRSSEIGLFAQDHWRVNSKLVITLGFRYDYYTNFVAEAPNGGPPHFFNPDGIRDTGAFTLGPFRQVDNPFEPDDLNLSLRFGLVFDPDRKGKTAIRLGYSNHFVPVNGQQFYMLVAIAPDQPFRTTFGRLEAQAVGLKYPAYNEDVLKLAQTGAATFSRQVLDPHVNAPYAHNFQLNLQRALSPTLNADVRDGICGKQRRQAPDAA